VAAAAAQPRRHFRHGAGAPLACPAPRRQRRRLAAAAVAAVAGDVAPGVLFIDGLHAPRDLTDWARRVDSAVAAAAAAAADDEAACLHRVGRYLEDFGHTAEWREAGAAAGAAARAAQRRFLRNAAGAAPLDDAARAQPEGGDDDSSTSALEAARADVERAVHDFSAVACDPGLSPALVATEEQARLLLEPLQSGAGALPRRPAASADSEGGSASASAAPLDPARLTLAVGGGSALQLRGQVALTDDAAARLCGRLGAGGGDAQDAADFLASLPAAGARVVAVRMHPPLLAEALLHHANSGARAAAHAGGWVRRESALLQVLEPLAAARQRLAALAGAGSHADALAAPMLPGGAPAARRFLVDLLAQLRPLADADVAELRAAARLEDGAAPGNADYYATRLSAASIAGRAASWGAFREYFTLQEVLSGVGRLLRAAFDVQLTPLTPPPEGGDWREAWAAGPGASLHAFRVLGPRREGGGRADLGVLLLDLHAPGRGGVPFTSLLTTCGGGRRTAVVAVRAPRQVDDEGRLAGPSILRALLHEVGHALHHLASAAAAGGSVRRGASGVGADLRELPAHVMEHLLRHPPALGLLGRHARLGVSLPARDAAALSLLLVESGGAPATPLALHEAVVAALADLDAHSATAADGVGGASTAWRAAFTAHSALPVGGQTLERLRALEAAASVGGAAHAYTLARLLGAAAWRRHLEAAPLAGGAAAFDALFSFGGGVPPAESVAALLGEGALLPVAGGGGWVPDLGAACFQELDLLG